MPWYSTSPFSERLAALELRTADLSASETREDTDQFAGYLIWADVEPMLPERRYAVEFPAATTTIQITDLVHVVDDANGDKLAGKTLEQDQVGYCKFALDRMVEFNSFANDPEAGSFIVTNDSGQIIGRGVIDFALRRASNITWHDTKIDKAMRAQINGQKPCVLWFTGFSGSGKSSVADRLEQKLHELGKRTYLLDGDNVRHGLNKDLGFTDEDRVENIRRVAEVAKLLVDAGLIVVTSFISPFRSERQMARSMMDEGEFIEVFVDTPLEICEQRDPKGLYKKARAGELKNFTGIDSDYETPENAEIVLNAGDLDPDTLAVQIITYLNAHS